MPHQIQNAPAQLGGCLRKAVQVCSRLHAQLRGRRHGLVRGQRQQHTGLNQLLQSVLGVPRVQEIRERRHSSAHGRRSIACLAQKRLRLRALFPVNGTDGVGTKAHQRP